MIAAIMSMEARANRGYMGVHTFGDLTSAQNYIALKNAEIFNFFLLFFKPHFFCEGKMKNLS